MTTTNSSVSRAPGSSHLSNLIVKSLLSLGLPMGPTVLLTVTGRKTGKSHTTPVGLFVREGRPYLFSTFGEVNWVRNLRVAREATLTRFRRRNTYRAVEQTPEQAAVVLRDCLAPYLKKPLYARTLRQHFHVAADAPLEDFVREARRHPVFELLPVQL